jgi:hypothetical protein
MPFLLRPRLDVRARGRQVKLDARRHLLAAYDARGFDDVLVARVHAAHQPRLVDLHLLLLDVRQRRHRLYVVRA